MLNFKLLTSFAVIIFIFVLSDTTHAQSNIYSTINGKQVDWILLFGNNADPVTGIPSDGKRKKTPIILVHGNNSESELQARWSTFIDRFFNLDEFDNEEFDVWIWKHQSEKPIGFNGYTGNAVELADCLNSFIFPFYQTGTKAVLVAHSRGGLICRSFMNYDNNFDGKLDGNRIAGLITLGTPHHGSPGAVPDWTAFALKENHLGPTVFDLLVGPNGYAFDTDRLGDLNLAWDNMDGAILSSVFKIEFDSEISSNGEMYLTERDTNQLVKINFADETIFFNDYWKPPDYKSLFGTLADLNEKDQFLQKIITYGAYDSSWLDNGYIDGQDFFILDHTKLKASTLLLGTFDIKSVTRDGVNFYANDGMVPLQSALLLDISDGDSFASELVGIIILNGELIESKKIVKEQRYFPGYIKDHLDLLDTSYKDYWVSIFNDIVYLTRDGKAGAMPWIPLLLLDEQKCVKGECP